MRRLILLRWFLFLPFLTFAQEKITDFANASTRSVNKTVYADTLSGKLLFYANMPEKAIHLWVSDGTKEGTKLLKDSLGESPQIYYDRTIKKYGYIYFGRFWKTDGEKIYELPIGRDSLRGLQLFANKLLVYFQYIKQTPGQPNVNVSSFGWLDSLNQVKIWENGIISFQIIDNTLHYIKHNSISQNYELHKIYADNTHIVNIISNPEAQLLSFIYFSKNNHDYYFFYTYQGWKFYHKPANDQENARLEDWTSNANYNVRSFRVKDSENNDYLLKFFNGIHIYKITENNQLTEQWSLPPNGFMPDKDFRPYDTNIVENVSISGNELIYTNAYLSEGVSSSIPLPIYIVSYWSAPQFRSLTNAASIFSNSKLLITSFIICTISPLHRLPRLPSKVWFNSLGAS
ncbi:hypothetical protein EWM59_26100 [Emticicia agri]|uniref:Uncharacterized protein n=1 Tax=Emticicia agri TaxID=2492393 RepID=A0A4Q5LTB4_9BACT|nr:hypothetical protein EWM59_26100 [Emticicia agri]